VLAKGISWRTARLDKAFPFKANVFHFISSKKSGISNLKKLQGRRKNMGLLFVCYLTKLFQHPDYKASDGMINE
jgi:hypothetical protein